MGVLKSQYFSPNAKYWTASSGNRTQAPPDRMWTLYYWAMESAHNMGVLVSWPPERGQILCNYSTPPNHQQASMYTYSMEGEGEPCQPAPSPWIPATQLKGDLRTPLTHNNTQQHTRTPNNRQQHTTTVHNSTRVHKITNVPLFKKLLDIIFFCGTITLCAISRDILRGPALGTI